ncbi:unnamed protein product [Closterium sp. NIES-64]|nr:unnamed protein product [Closterium sp. NIES-64]
MSSVEPFRRRQWMREEELAQQLHLHPQQLSFSYGNVSLSPGSRRQWMREEELARQLHLSDLYDNMRQWMREEELARQLHLHPKQLSWAYGNVVARLPFISPHQQAAVDERGGAGTAAASAPEAAEANTEDAGGGIDDRARAQEGVGGNHLKQLRRTLKMLEGADDRARAQEGVGGNLLKQLRRTLKMLEGADDRARAQEGVGGNLLKQLRRTLKMLEGADDRARAQEGVNGNLLKQLRRTLKSLEEELMVVHEHRKENTRAAKKLKGEGEEGKEGEGEGEGSKWEGKPGQKPKQHSHSYCCLHYPQIYDVVRYRIHRAKKAIKDELDSRKEVMYLLCPNPHCKARYSTLDTDRLIDPVDFNLKCERCHSELEAESDMLGGLTLCACPSVPCLSVHRYSTLDTDRLIDPVDFNLKCERCHSELEAESDMLGGGGGGGGGVDGEDNTRKKKKEALQNMLARFERQLKPLMEQIVKVKDLTPPYFGSLSEWEAKASPAQRAAAVGGDIPKALPRLAGPGGGGAGSTPLPFMGETRSLPRLAGPRAAGGRVGAGSTPLPFMGETRVGGLQAQRAAAVGGEIPKALPCLAGSGGGGAGSTPLPFMGETRGRGEGVLGGSTPLPFMGETTGGGFDWRGGCGWWSRRVCFESTQREDVVGGTGGSAGGGGGGGEGALTKPAEMKDIPKWAIREGMVLTAVQQGYGA